MQSWIGILIEHRDCSFMIGIVKSRLASPISSLRGRGDHRLRILVPVDSVVRKGYTDTIIAPANRDAYVVHRIAIILPVAKGVLKNSANHLRIAGVFRIPRPRGLGQHQQRTMGLMCRHIDRLVIDRIRILSGVAGVDALTAPPELPYISSLNHRGRI